MSSICALDMIDRYLIRIFQVLVIGFRYYPILVAIHIDTVVALFLATIYSWLDVSVGIVNQGICSNYYSIDNLYEETNGSSTDDIKSLLDYYGTGSNLIAVDVCIDISRYICLAYISIKLAELFIKKIRARMILKQKSISTSVSLSREEKQLLSYMKHFIEARYVRYLFLPVDRRPKTTFHQSLTTIFNELFGNNKFPLPAFVGPYVASIMFATVGVLLQLTLQLAAIRRNLFQVYHGDITELPHRATLNTVSLATSNFHFLGILSVMLMYMNKLLAQYAFLQHWGDVLALDNRRWLMIFLHFNAFFDALLGVVLCVIRIVFTVVASMVCMCRLDYSPLGRKLERFDNELIDNDILIN
ncbi:unnamed protein product [Didymodactylos carnosus]|uniref:Uncharacterized protein n=1 Tax=Didymodactylos carnosus TaxID=1234261 RepID=A0A8S2E0L7_9BILA|nr:unnamed protein product [Didymodactylos carnosus]CAF3822247.1 unnamed protein product [Didymodactylos carnosus]